MIGSRPPAKISWWLSDQRLGTAKVDVSDNGNISKTMISLMVSKHDNGKQVTCKSENAEIPNSILEEHIVLDIECK